MLAFLGGTGPEGRGLALRYALAGKEVIIGSRRPDRAVATAEELCLLAPGTSISGAGNREACLQGDMVFLTFPYDAQRTLLPQIERELVGKVVVSAIAPLVFDKGGARTVQVDEGSAAMQAQALLPHSKVAAAFQNLSAAELLANERPIEGDVVVCSDHREAKMQVMTMVGLIKNLRAVDGGNLDSTRYVEEITALLVNINRIYHTHSSIKITGL